MNGDNYNLSEITVSQFNDFDSNSICYFFKKSIELNSNIKIEINNVIKRYFENETKLLLSYFHLKYLTMLEHLINENNDINELRELSNYFINSFSKYFEMLNDNLSIQHKEDLDKFKSILKISDLIMEDVLLDYDEELAYEVLFQIKYKLKKEHLFDNSITYKAKTENYDCKIIIKHNENKMRRLDLPLMEGYYGL